MLRNAQRNCYYSLNLISLIGNEVKLSYLRYVGAFTACFSLMSIVESFMRLFEVEWAILGLN